MVHKKCSLNIVFLDFLLSLRCNVKCIKQVVMNSEIILEKIQSLKNSIYNDLKFSVLKIL